MSMSAASATLDGMSLPPRLDASCVHLPAPPPPPPSSGPPGRHYHVYFLPGNPACVGYYHPFLVALAERLRRGDGHRRPVPGGNPSHRLKRPEQEGKEASEDGRLSPPPPRVSVYAASYRNFTDPAPEETEETEEARTAGSSRHRVLSLQEAITDVEARLERYAAAAAKAEERSGPVRVILVGHSVGAYVGLEILRRRAETARQPAAADPALRVVGFVALFPTVTEIAQSPSGRRFAVSAGGRGPRRCWHGG